MTMIVRHKAGLSRKRVRHAPSRRQSANERLGMAVKALAESTQKLAATETKNQDLRTMLNEKECQIRRLQEAKRIVFQWAFDKCKRELLKATEALRTDHQYIHANREAFQGRILKAPGRESDAGP
jgi:septal ring factor EnvC (AmiA/AmiB activator)